MAVAPAQGPKHLVEIPPTWVTDDNIEIAWGVVTPFPRNAWRWHRVETLRPRKSELHIARTRLTLARVGRNRGW